MINVIDMTDEQIVAAANSLAKEISNLCGGQPAAVVMVALASLAAYGLVTQASDVSSAGSRLEDHIALIKHQMGKHGYVRE